MNNRKWLTGIAALALLSVLTLGACDNPSGGGGSNTNIPTNTGVGGNVTMILRNEYASPITKWWFWRPETSNFTPSTQDVNIPTGESLTISLVMTPPFSIKQVYIYTADDKETVGWASFSPDRRTSTITLKADGETEDDS